MEVIEAIRSELDRLRQLDFATPAYKQGWDAALAQVDSKVKNMERTLTVLAPDTIWCFTLNTKVDTAKCITNCGSPELRPRCWAAKGIADSFVEPEG